MKYCFVVDWWKWITHQFFVLYVIDYCLDVPSVYSTIQHFPMIEMFVLTALLKKISFRTSHMVKKIVNCDTWFIDPIPWFRSKSAYRKRSLWFSALLVIKFSTKISIITFSNHSKWIFDSSFLALWGPLDFFLKYWKFNN